LLFSALDVVLLLSFVDNILVVFFFYMLGFSVVGAAGGGRGKVIRRPWSPIVGGA
jgi:hypothetical protein